MDLDRLAELETIDPRPLPPWRHEAFAEVEIEPDREVARERAEIIGSRADVVVYSDASGRQGHVGAAVAALDDNLEVIEPQQIHIGPMDRWSVHIGELIGIFYAISLVYKLGHQQRPSNTATILCDSRSALQAIQNPGNKTGQTIIRAILHAAGELQAEGIALRLQWMPGHCDNPGNDAADRLAKEAAGPGKTHPFRPPLTREKAFIRNKIRA
jgi:ribonuclease HI